MAWACFILFVLTVSSDIYKTFITMEKYKVYVDEKQSAGCCYYPKQSV